MTQKGLLKNQTYEHQELAEKALRWAANKCTGAGNRGSVEVFIDGYGIADSLIIQAIQSRFRFDYGLQDDRFRFSNEKHIFVFESKVSRSDFQTIFPKLSQGVIPGNFNFIVCPERMVSAIEIPCGWGLLNPSGNGLKEIVKPDFFEVPEIQRLKIESDMLWHHANKWANKRIEVLSCPECGKEIADANKN
jgi:hypothetical protein